MYYISKSNGSNEQRKNKKGRKTYHLKKRHKSVERVIEVNVGILPPKSFVETDGLVWNDTHGDSRSTRVNTLEERPAKELHSHYAEYEPEDHADQKHVPDTWDGEQQRVDNDLKLEEQKSVNISSWQAVAEKRLISS